MMLFFFVAQLSLLTNPSQFAKSPFGYDQVLLVLRAGVR